MKFLTRISALSAATMVAVGTGITYASEYSGAGLTGGSGVAGTVVGAQLIRPTVLAIVKKVLSYMALAAVVVTVIAGIILIFSGGNDENKDRAKRIVFFAIAGLFVILIAQGLVEIFATIPTTN
jgi:hypothetical protein